MSHKVRLPIFRRWLGPEIARGIDCGSTRLPAGQPAEPAFKVLCSSQQSEEPLAARSRIDFPTNLHRQAPAELDFFVLYSSAAALCGSPGRANYCAANAFLDALAQKRAHQGMPAMSIRVGWTSVDRAPWQGCGEYPFLFSSTEITTSPPQLSDPSNAS